MCILCQRRGGGSELSGFPTHEAGEWVREGGSEGGSE